MNTSPTDGSAYSGTMPDDLAAVLVTIVARWSRNPEALRSQTIDVAGDYAQTVVYTVPAGSFTLVEHAVLARYRRRTA